MLAEPLSISQRPALERNGLVTIRSKKEPVLAGYNCIGLVTHVCWENWPEWVMERTPTRKPRQVRISGGKVRHAKSAR